MAKHSYRLTLLPSDPLIGIGLENSKVVFGKNDYRKCRGIKFGLLFFHFKFYWIGDKIS